MKIRNKQPLSIYIHIPFCKQKCLYCDFLSAPACGQERESYVKALLREISLMADSCRAYQVISVFFGGGTPSLLNKSQIKRIVTALQKNYDLAKDAEISLECNPATANLAKLKAYRECGINRLSIGLQSAKDTELKELGRIHNYRQFLKTYEDARKAGFTNINIDIMSALPGQTLDSYLETIDKVLALQPEHISAYSLIIEEGTPFFARYGEPAAAVSSLSEEKTGNTVSSLSEEKTGNTVSSLLDGEMTDIFSSLSDGEPANTFPALPDEETERKMYHKTNQLLKKAGYTRYEISNFAKKGYECRHNLTYWTGVDYIGFGTGAASYFQGYRYKNISDIYRYREGIRKMIGNLSEGTCAAEISLREEVMLLSEEDKIEEFMFLGLRLKKGVEFQVFEKKFGKTMDETYGTILSKLVSEGVLIRTAKRIYLSKKGTDVANYVMAQFLLS